MALATALGEKLDAIEALLQMCGHDVRSYANGAAFLSVIATVRTGCIVMDVRMPQVDGLAFQRHMVEANITLPIIFMSGYAEEQLRKSIDIEKVAFLPKPFSVQELAEAARKALSAG